MQERSPLLQEHRTQTKRKIPLGELRAIARELEDFAGPGKPRGCQICLRGDQAVVAVAKIRGYKARQVAEFLIQTHGYPAHVMNDQAVYRHWHRCVKQKAGAGNMGNGDNGKDELANLPKLLNCPYYNNANKESEK